MNKPQEMANQIILRAYKNDGQVEYDDIKDIIVPELLPEINEILESYGFLNTEFANNTWLFYSLSNYGHDFASQGAFQGLEKERKQKADDRWLDRKYKWFCILAVIIAFASLVVSIIAIWPRLQ